MRSEPNIGGDAGPGKRQSMGTNQGEENVSRKMLVADEVAELLRVSKQRIYELVRTRAIPVTRLGERQYRFEAEAINQWIERGGTSDENERQDSDKGVLV